MPERMGFYLDSSACTNCKVCQIVCMDKHDLPAGVNWRRVLQYGGGSWKLDGKAPVPSGVFSYSLSISCMHCADPACVKVCSSGAISKRRDGFVLIDGKRCAGCRKCEQACPYGAPQFHAARKVMTKCDFCQDLLAQGEKPACVAACPTRALDAGPLAELRARHGRADAVEPLPAPRTGPSLVLTPHRHAQPSGKGKGRLLALPAAT